MILPLLLLTLAVTAETAGVTLHTVVYYIDGIVVFTVPNAIFVTADSVVTTANVATADTYGTTPAGPATTADTRCMYNAATAG